MDMKLSSSEKQSLLSSLVVGCLVGTFIAYAAVAFNSEFKLQGIAISDANPAIKLTRQRQAAYFVRDPSWE